MMHCHVTVKQMGDRFTRGARPRCHQPGKGTLIKTKISLEAEKKAAADVFKSAGVIVQELVT